ncbi:hypothetical protein ACH347_29890 [Saccharopolyspora sp. 5N102]
MGVWMAVLGLVEVEGVFPGLAGAVHGKGHEATAEVFQDIGSGGAIAEFDRAPWVGWL